MRFERSGKELLVWGEHTVPRSTHWCHSGTLRGHLFPRDLLKTGLTFVSALRWTEALLE